MRLSEIVLWSIFVSCVADDTHLPRCLAYAPPENLSLSSPVSGAFSTANSSFPFFSFSCSSSVSFSFSLSLALFSFLPQKKSSFLFSLLFFPFCFSVQWDILPSWEYTSLIPALKLTLSYKSLNNYHFPPWVVIVAAVVVLTAKGSASSMLNKWRKKSKSVNVSMNRWDRLVKCKK